MELPLYLWNDLDGSMELLGCINGYMTYLTDFKCFYYKNVSRNWQCILGTALWIHGYIYHHDDVYTRNSTIKYNEDKITGVQNETFVKCRQKYRICGYLNMIIGYSDGYIYGSSWKAENFT